MRKLIVYELVEKDIQIVAEQTLGRKLNRKEVSDIKNVIAEKIDWFEVIDSAITEQITNK